MKPNYISSSDFFLLRSPAFSISELAKVNGFNDIDAVNNYLLEFFKQPFQNNSLYIASPTLHSELTKFYERKFEDGKHTKYDRLFRSLYRYFVRCHSKSVPFGLFSGFALGEVESNVKNRIILSDFNQHKYKTRIDFELLSDLADSLLQVNDIFEGVKYYPNPSIYYCNDKIRFAEYIKISGNKKYTLSSLDPSDYISKVLKICETGAQYDQLLLLLVNNFEADDDEARDFIRQLVENQIIITEITPNITGESYITRLIGVLIKINKPSLKPIIRHLEMIMSEMNSKVLSLPKITELVKELGLRGEYQSNIQTDLELSTQTCFLRKEDLEDIIKNIALLSPFVKERVKEPLEDFKYNFSKKYGNAEVELCSVLDSENGISFAGIGDQTAIEDLTDDIHIKKNTIKKSKLISWNATSKFLLSIFLEALEKGEKSINLSEKNLKDILGVNENMEVAESSYLFGSMIHDTDENLKFLLKVLDGPSSSKLLGRFCPHNNRLTDKVKSLLKEEENLNQDFIYAEIVYVPQDRIGNVMIRPHLREYEIIYIGFSTLPLERQIPVSDIMVSVSDDQIILRSKKLNKRIIPRESSAYHPSAQDLPIYVFLSYLYVQEYPHNLMFSWPEIINNEAFLPRLSYKNIIVSPATWNVSCSKLLQYINDPDNGEVNLGKILVQKFGLPKAVLLKDDGEDILLDLENIMSIQVILGLITRKKYLKFEEDFFYKKECLVTDSKNNFYNNEVLIPLTYKADIDFEDNKIVKNIKSQITNPRFLPGSNYLYFQIFLSEKYSDNFIVKVLHPFLIDKSNKEFYDSYFFIRYDENGHHLRLRFINHRSTDQLSFLLGKFGSVMKQQIDSHLIQDYKIVPYEQEIDVYGMKFIHNMEEIFYFDSKFSHSVISHINNIQGREFLLLDILIACMIDVFDLFQFSLMERTDFIEDLSAGYFKEFNGAKMLKVQLDKKYRILRERIFFILDNPYEMVFDPVILKLILQRKDNFSKIISRILPDQSFGIDLRNRLVERIIHLTINRLFKTDPRKKEMLIYYLLKKALVGFSKYSATKA